MDENLFTYKISSSLVLWLVSFVLSKDEEHGKSVKVPCDIFWPAVTFLHVLHLDVRN